MKTLKQLKEEFIGFDKDITIKIKESVVGHYSGEGDMDFKTKDGDLLAWISNSNLDNEEEGALDKEISGEINISNNVVFQDVQAYIDLAEWLGATLPETMTVEVIKEVESNEQHKLGGMVAAYENILLGRDVIVGK